MLNSFNSNGYLPSFKSETKYKKMEAGKEYTLEELRTIGEYMREYKFRGQVRYNSKKYKKGEWYYGNYRRGRNDRSFIEEDYEEVEVIPETVGQYTGLHDKNGKEIYEGDIVRFSEVDTAIVEWNEKYAYFMVKPIQDYYFDSDILGHAIEYNNVEIIGNIYENKKLLEA
ncbi:MAG: hypothetical protein HFJ30_00360 [Clostridia bacterium]|jgi:hypothetical protein|nr:hypothetical protein [Clostridia bacterium]